MIQRNLLAAIIASAGFLHAQSPQSGPSKAPLYPNFPTETPTKFQPSTNSFDYVQRDEMIPMREA
jgi:hypothetical protein